MSPCAHRAHVRDNMFSTDPVFEKEKHLGFLFPTMGPPRNLPGLVFMANPCNHPQTDRDGGGADAGFARTSVIVRGFACLFEADLLNVDGST